MSRVLSPLAALLLAGCGSKNVVSDGADSSLMLKGHDPVAYFTLGKPTLGRPDIKAEHQGVTSRLGPRALGERRVPFSSMAGSTRAMPDGRQGRTAASRA